MEFVAVVLVFQIYKQFIEVFKFCTLLLYVALANVDPTQAILSYAFLKFKILIKKNLTWSGST